MLGPDHRLRVILDVYGRGAGNVEVRVARERDRDVDVHDVVRGERLMHDDRVCRRDDARTRAQDGPRGRRI
jgi:hypothetical protein